MRTKQTVCESCTSIILKLPSDLLVEILTRLPLKSLTQCKVVCKQWREILTDPCFGLVYSNHSPFCAFFFYNYHRPGVYLVEISESRECLVTNFKPILPLLDCCSPSNLRLIGSSSGILCLYSGMEKLIYIWNPLISGEGSIMEVPQPHLANDCYREHYVFGYSFAADRFKILRILFQEFLRHEVKFMIFTVGVDDGWRCLPDSLFKNLHYGYFSEGVVLNGIYHYIMDDKSDEGTKIHICTFDMGEEKQGVMSWPHTPSHKQTCIYNGRLLSVLHDQLCVNEYDFNCREVTIWIMKEYGVMESWSKFCVFKDLSSEYSLPLPIAILDCGDIVLTRKAGSKLWLYSPSQRKHRKVEDMGIELITKMNIRYAPSFSPLGEIIKPGK